MSPMLLKTQAQICAGSLKHGLVRQTGQSWRPVACVASASAAGGERGDLRPDSPPPAVAAAALP